MKTTYTLKIIHKNNSYAQWRIKNCDISKVFEKLKQYKKRYEKDYYCIVKNDSNGKEIKGW